MIIRKIGQQDAKGLLDMLLSLDKETKNMMYEEFERPRDIKYINEMIKETENSNSFIFVADNGREIVGYLSAVKGQFNRIKHTAYVVTGILSSFQNQGIGSKLFIELEKWAKENKITRLELTVMCQNKAAINLYQKFGFEIEGIKPNSMKVDDEYLDEYYMGKLL